METITNYLRVHPLRCVIITSLFVLFIGIGCYTAGQRTAERDAQLQRVQSTQKQLEYTSTELTNATTTNSTARGIVTDGIRLNDAIDASIDRSTARISDSETANGKTSTAITDAQLIVRDASATAEQSERVISDSTAILDRAYKRAQKAASSGKTK